MSLTLLKNTISYSAKCLKMCGFLVFPHYWKDIMHFSKKSREMWHWCTPPSTPHQGVHGMKNYITRDIYFGHLDKVHSASFEAIWILLLFCSLILAFINASSLQQVLLWYLCKDNFIFFFPSIFINWISYWKVEMLHLHLCLFRYLWSMDW